MQTHTQTQTVDIGIAEDALQQIARGLAGVMADTYTLYLKTHYFHWNVTGPRFHDLHVLFEEQYTELWQAVDVIAERIRALGHRAPGTSREIAELSQIPEQDDVPSSRDMIEELLRGHEATVRRIRAVYPTAEDARDQATVDLLTERLQVHEKAAWMLRSTQE